MRDAIEGVLRGVGRLFGKWAELMAPPEDNYLQALLKTRYPNIKE